MANTLMRCDNPGSTLAGTGKSQLHWIVANVLAYYVYKER